MHRRILQTLDAHKVFVVFNGGDRHYLAAQIVWMPAVEHIAVTPTHVRWLSNGRSRRDDQRNLVVVHGQR